VPDPIPNLDEIFADFPAGQELLGEVRAFYGPMFFVEGFVNLDGVSKFSIDDGGASARFQGATIKLNMGSDRVEAAAMHELLHLSLPIRGFALINSLELSSAHQANIPYIDNVLGKLVNVVQHDIFVNDFLRAGLPLNQFQNKRSVVANYKKEFKSYKGKEIIRDLEWWPWSWWAFEYLNNYISIQHGDDAAARLAQETKMWGYKALPGFARTADQIKAWVKAGEHRSPATYRAAMVKLMKLLHLPPVKQFSSLTAVEGAAPNVEFLA
jgi:hypothetical protein